MKTNLSDFFDQVSAEELDMVLDDKLELDPLKEDALKRVQEKVWAKVNSPLSTPKKKKGKQWRFAVTAAASIGLLATVSAGTYAYAAERQEYQTAVGFFEEYELSTEGLSRGEIKAVYRDITTKAFVYSKTAQVLENSLADEVVEGYEIFQAGSIPEKVENLWNYKNFSENIAEKGSWDAEEATYQYGSEYQLDSELGFDVHDNSYLEKYVGDVWQWRVSFTEFEMEGYERVEGGVMVYGRTPTWSSRQTCHAWLAMVSSEGKILWKCELENGFEDEYISAVLEDEEGYTVISRGDFAYFCLSHYNRKGKQMSFQKTHVGNYGIWNVARLGDGYLVQLGSYVEDEYAKIIKVNSVGNITDAFSYSGEDSYYYITDMIEFEGNIYLSAYEVPKVDKEQSAGGRYEIAPVLNYLFDNKILKISSEELTPMVRENYTAVLLVCDMQTGIPQEFYSVKGCMGGKLGINEAGNLLWGVESIETTFFSPMTSAFTIGGTGYVFRYTFDTRGMLVGQEKTGEVVNYAR
ncbi:MAG: hypothetical protein E7293_01615 [Lachnospiraceae bacterium]|nr:hypothetical protein [Lachnospiraceae bacterium]